MALHLNQKPDTEDLARMFSLSVEVQNPDGAVWHRPARKHDNGPATLDIASVPFHVHRDPVTVSFGAELCQAAAEMTAWAIDENDLDERSVESAVAKLRAGIIALAKAAARLRGLGACEYCGNEPRRLSRHGWCQDCESNRCSRCGERVAADGSDRCWDCNDACARAGQRRQPNLYDMEQKHDALVEALREGVQP